MKQLCPKCNGQGIVTKPPYIPGDINEWTSADVVHTCNLCNGSMVIDTFDEAAAREDEAGKIREAVAQYMYSEGCGCCEQDGHDDDKEHLCELLKMEKHSDGSGYNYQLYLKNEKL